MLAKISDVSGNSCFRPQHGRKGLRAPRASCKSTCLQMALIFFLYMVMIYWQTTAWRLARRVDGRHAFHGKRHFRRVQCGRSKRLPDLSSMAREIATQSPAAKTAPPPPQLPRALFAPRQPVRRPRPLPFDALWRIQSISMGSVSSCGHHSVRCASARAQATMAPQRVHTTQLPSFSASFSTAARPFSTRMPPRCRMAWHTSRPCKAQAL